MLYPLLCVALLLVGANASDANHTYIKMISGWDDITQPSRDFNSGWCHVAIQPNSTLAWDCHIEFTPVAGSEWGPGRTWNTTWNLGDPMQDDGTFKFVLGADESHKPLSKFSAFLQANNFMFHVAEKNPHDAILLKPSANGTNWDCSPHHLYPHKLPECRDSMIMQPEWTMVLWDLQVCNDGFKPGKGPMDFCTLSPGAKAYFARKGLVA